MFWHLKTPMNVIGSFKECSGCTLWNVIDELELVNTLIKMTELVCPINQRFLNNQ